MNATTTRHAVRWFQRKVRSRFTEQWTRWHITDDARFTLCGRGIDVASSGGPLLPEADEDLSITTCTPCLIRAYRETLAAAPEPAGERGV